VRCLMYSGVRNSLLIGCAMVACLATLYAQGLNGIIENYYPAQFQPGQTTTLNLATNGGRGNALMTVEVTPSTGITVGTPKGSDVREGVIWYQVPITVAPGTAAGKRTLQAVTAQGKTQPVDVMIPDHALTLSNLKVTSSAANGKTVDFQFNAAEQGGGALGTPKAWFTLKCGKEPEVGVVNGKAANGVVTATIPNPKTISGAAAPSYSPMCDLEVRATDAGGVESNTITAKVDFK
jgi:hypothetical protein